MNTPLITIITVSSFEDSRLTSTFNSFISLSSSYEIVHVIPKNDQTGKKIGEIFDPFFSAKYMRINDTNRGVYYAMNLGIKAANGKYLIFVNAGDSLVDPMGLEVELLRANECDGFIFNGEFQWNIQQVSSRENLRSFINHFPNSYISHQTIVFNKSFLLLRGGFNERYKVAADFESIVQLSKSSKIEFSERKITNVEFPNWSSNKSTLGRFESYLICLLNLNIDQLIIAFKNIFLKELNFLILRLKKIS